MTTIIQQSNPDLTTDLDGGPLVIFTRYLYIKSEVEHSLLNAILCQNTEQALFWGFELYHSTNNYTDLLAILSNIYNTYYIY